MNLTKEFEALFKGLDNKSLEEPKIEYKDIRKDAWGNLSKQKSTGKSKAENNRPLTNSEKNNLTKWIWQLSPTSLRGILTVVNAPEKNGVVEFDINKLSPVMCHKLDTYVKEQL